MSETKKTKPGSKLSWDFQVLTDLKSGQLNDVEPHDHLPQSGSTKRARVNWQDKPRTFQSLFHGNKQRQEACWEAPSMGVCRDIVEQLHKALETATLQDTRISVAGEKQRIFDRAMSMKRALAGMDELLAFPETDVPASATDATNAPAHEHAMPFARSNNKQHVRIQRSSNEAEPDANPEQCITSVCLLMAALYEQTPFTNGELRRRIYHDFTTLKRHFRNDELTVLHGRSGPVGELFDAIKELDRRGGLQNLIGIEFEDWKVHSRIDKFVLADQLEVQVTAEASEGPVGKFVCKFKTFVSLGLLHMRLLREIYYGVFADTHPPKGNNEWMTSKDELDFIDFTEAMARNIPFRHTPKTPQFYCWMYAPEVNASPEMWREIFGEGGNVLPSMFDGVHTPDDVVEQVSVEEGYALNMDKAKSHDFRTASSSMSPVGFPWADDLLGAFLRKLAQKKDKKGGQAKAGTNISSTHGSGPSSSGQNGSSTPGRAAHTAANGSGSTHGSIKSEPQAAGQAGPTPPPASSSGAAGPNGHQPQANGSTEHPATATPGSEAKKSKPLTPNAEETGKLALPLGVFLVGLICSGSFTNTQIHVEDLLLMSINLNMFGAPKVWWWIPQESIQAFKEYAEEMTDGGRKEVYTKSISPFLLDSETQQEHLLPLQALQALGAKRAIQMPSTAVLTMPGYAFHFTVSMGFNIAESCNLFLEVMGWTFEKLWNARPLEQYPEEEDDMAKYLRDTGVLATLGVPDRLPRHKAEVHRQLAPRLPGGYYQDAAGGELRRCFINQDTVKYVALPGPMPIFRMDAAKGEIVPVQGTQAVPKNVIITV